MRSFRLCALGALAASILALSSTLGACGGGSGPDNPVPDGGGPDGTTQPEAGSDTGAPIQIGAKDVAVYLGQTAKLDASQTNAGGAPVTFSWTLKSLPTGSAVTSGSIAGASTATPSLVPDVAGDYVLTLTASAGTINATKDVKVSAFAAPVFFEQTRPYANPPYLEIQTIGADGLGAHALTCQLELPVDGGADAGDRGQFIFLSLFLGILGVDSWEAPAGQPSRVAFSDFRIAADGGAQAGLAVGTTDSTCQNPPQTVRVVPGSGALAIQPQFSPDGTRIAFIENTNNTTDVASVAFDGSAYHHVSPYCAGTDAGGSNCIGSYASRPQWIDATHLGWIQTQNNSTAWSIVSAPDQDTAALTTVMTCAGEAPRQFVALKDGTFLTSFRITQTAPINLVVLKPNASKGCDTVRNLTNFAGAGSRARDFSLSPDGTQVVYLDHESPDAADNQTGSGGTLYTVNVDGSGTPKPVPGQPNESPVGARWVGGGTQIAWTRIDPTKPDAGVTGALVSVVPVAGGTIKDVAKSDNATFVVSASNGGCSVAGGGAGMVASAVGAMLGLVALLRRRRR